MGGFGKGELAVLLTPTLCDKIAQLGQRLIDGAAKSLAEDFFRRFDEELQQRYPAPAGEVVAMPAPTAKANLPAWVWGTIAVLVAAAVYMATRG